MCLNADEFNIYEFILIHVLIGKSGDEWVHVILYLQSDQWKILCQKSDIERCHVLLNKLIDFLFHHQKTQWKLINVVYHDEISHVDGVHELDNENSHSIFEFICDFILKNKDVLWICVSEVITHKSGCCVAVDWNQALHIQDDTILTNLSQCMEFAVLLRHSFVKSDFAEQDQMSLKLQSHIHLQKFVEWLLFYELQIKKIQCEQNIFWCLFLSLFSDSCVQRHVDEIVAVLTQIFLHLHKQFEKMHVWLNDHCDVFDDCRSFMKLVNLH